MKKLKNKLLSGSLVCSMLLSPVVVNMAGMMNSTVYAAEYSTKFTLDVTDATSGDTLKEGTLEFFFARKTDAEKEWISDGTMKLTGKKISHTFTVGNYKDYDFKVVPLKLPFGYKVNPDGAVLEGKSFNYAVERDEEAVQALSEKATFNIVFHSDSDKSIWLNEMKDDKPVSAYPLQYADKNGDLGYLFAPYRSGKDMLMVSDSSCASQRIDLENATLPDYYEWVSESDKHFNIKVASECLKNVTPVRYILQNGKITIPNLKFNKRYYIDRRAYLNDSALTDLGGAYPIFLNERSDRIYRYNLSNEDQETINKYRYSYRYFNTKTTGDTHIQSYSIRGPRLVNKARTSYTFDIYETKEAMTEDATNDYSHLTDGSVSVDDEEEVDSALEDINSTNDPALDELKKKLEEAKRKIEELKEKERIDELVQRATEAVQEAEQNPSEANINKAKDLVNAIPDSDPRKAELKKRLDEIENRIKNPIFEVEKGLVADAERAVSTPNFDLNTATEKYKKAESAVVTMANGETKDDLLRRLAEVDKKIEARKADMKKEQDQKAAEDAVAKAESDKSPEAIADAKAKANALEDGAKKDELLKRIAELEKQLDDAKKAEAKKAAEKAAEDAVAKAESDKSPEAIADAKAKVNALEDGAKKDELLKRIAELEKQLDDAKKAEVKKAAEKAAEDAVAKAESDKSPEAIADAKAKVGALEDGAKKDELLKRIAELEKQLDDAKKAGDAFLTKYKDLLEKDLKDLSLQDLPKVEEALKEFEKLPKETQVELDFVLKQLQKMKATLETLKPDDGTVYQTHILYVDQNGKQIAEETVTTKGSEKVVPNVPKGYKLSESNPVIEPGKEVRLTVEKVEAGKTTTEKKIPKLIEEYLNRKSSSSKASTASSTTNSTNKKQVKDKVPNTGAHR